MSKLRNFQYLIRNLIRKFVIASDTNDNDRIYWYIWMNYYRAKGDFLIWTSRRKASILMISCRSLASSVVIKNSCCGWFVCRRVFPVDFALLISSSWRTRLRIGAKCQVSRTWTLFAEENLPFPWVKSITREGRGRCVISLDIYQLYINV